MMAAIDAVKLAGDVVKLGKAVYDHAQLVKANRAQCRRLGERARIIVQSIERLDKIENSDNFCAALLRMKQTLKECCAFVGRFKDSRWFIQVIRATGNKGQFEALNSGIFAASQDLNLGLTAQQIFNRDEDRKDQKADMADLHKNQSEIMRLLEENIKEQQKSREYLTKIRLERGEHERFVLKRLQSVREMLVHLDQKQVGADHPHTGEPKIEISFYDLDFHEALLEDRNGTFYLGALRGEPVTIKTFSTPLSEPDYDYLKDEVHRMSHLNHDGILKCVGACLEKERTCVVFQQGNKRTLRDKLNLKEISVIAAIDIIRQIAGSLEYLAQEGICHRKLTSRNVLVDNATGQVKLLNVGFDRLLRQSVSASHTYTPDDVYTAPELLLQFPHEITESCSVYSFGVLMLEILTGKQPFLAHLPDLSKYIDSGGREQIPHSVPEFHARLIELCWHQDPSQRPSFRYLLSQIDGDSFYAEAQECEKRKDMKGAFMHYQQAADKGYLRAKASLATFYMQGMPDVVEKNIKRAQELLHDGAEGGHVRSMHNLGSFYANGLIDGKPDISQACFWLKKAGEQGDERAAAKARQLSH